MKDNFTTTIIGSGSAKPRNGNLSSCQLLQYNGKSWLIDCCDGACTEMLRLDISINKIDYEIDDRYAKQKVRIRYSPDFQKVFVVEPSGQLTPIHLRPLNKQENADIKRQRFRFSDREEKEQ